MFSVWILRNVRLFLVKILWLTGHSLKMIHLYLYPEIHVRSFSSIHVIVRINVLMIDGLHCWMAYIQFTKSRLFCLVSLNFRFVFFSSPTCPIKGLDSVEASFSVKLMSSLMADFCKWNGWYKKSNKRISVVLSHIRYLGLSSFHPPFS